MARRDNYNAPCYYLKGLQPRANTTPTTEPYWSAYPISQGANIHHWDEAMQIYTDGSGGTHSGDPRLRRCGWALVINSANGGMGSAPVGYYGEYGSLDGRQTVPRAELTA
eukprot:10088502-Karenia_brevis.AAC.1